MTDRRRTRLRVRLCLAFTSIIALLMVGQAVYVFLTTSRESRSSQQHVLQRDARRLEGRLATKEPLAVTLAELRGEGLFQRGSTTLRQFLAADGTVLEGSDLLGAAEPLLSADDVRRVTAGGSVLSVGWREGRRPAYAIALPTSPPVVVVAMARNDWAAAQRQRLLRFELVIIPMSTLAGAVLAWLIIGRQLSRLRLIVRAAVEVAAGGRRAPDPGPKDELFAISTALTEITESLRSALDYQQRFAAQAAHELRTPLTIMRAEADLARSSDSLEEARGALVSIGEETEKLAALVQDLLAFGQATSPALPMEAVAGTELVASATQPLVGLASDRGVGLLIEVDAVTVQVSRVGIEHAIRNLVENAINAAPTGSDVRVSGLRVDGWWRLAVDDDGPGVASVLGHRVFEPFVGNTVGGHGLGLTFVKLIAEAHQGKATMERRPDGTTRFCLVLPAMTATGPP